MTRTIDAPLMRKLHAAWNRRGCGVCNGHPVEVHHVRKRSQLGADSVGNTVGLCGAFSPNRHHEMAEDGRLELYLNQDHRMVWIDHTTGERGMIRYPSDYTVFESGTPPNPLGVPVNGAAVGAPVPAAPQLPPVGAAGIPSTPEERFAYLQQLGQQTTGGLLKMAVVLLHVKETKEWDTLDYPSFKDYYGESGLGLSRGTVSKMVKVATVYRARWRETLQTGASVEKLYLAQQAAEDVDEALGLAANQPLYELRAKAAREPAPEDQPRCESCGQVLRG